MASQARKTAEKRSADKTAPAKRRKRAETVKSAEARPASAAAPKETQQTVSAAHKLADAAALQSLLASNFARPAPAMPEPVAPEAPPVDQPDAPPDEAPDGAETDDSLAAEEARSQRGKWLGRAVKSMAGLLLLALAVWVPAQQLLQVASAEAVVNARLITLRAPIEGAIVATGSGPTVGNEFGAGATLFEIDNPRIDRSRLNDAVRAVEDSLDERLRIEAALAGLGDQQTMLEAQLDDFREARMALIEARIANGTAAGPDAFNARDELQIELAALRRGIFVGDSYNDRPGTALRLDQIEIEIARLEADLAVNRARHPRLVAARAREAAFVAEISHAGIAAPGDGRVWEMLTAPGEQVVKGQDLVRMLDCSLAVVTAVVSEAVYNQLVPGTAARFTFREGGPALEGRVVQLTGVSAAPANFAILPSALRAESFRVAVAVPGLAEREGCTVGRTGRVVFDTKAAAR